MFFKLCAFVFCLFLVIDPAFADQNKFVFSGAITSQIRKNVEPHLDAFPTHECDFSIVPLCEIRTSVGRLEISYTESSTSFQIALKPYFQAVPYHKPIPYSDLQNGVVLTQPEWTEEKSDRTLFKKYKILKLHLSIGSVE
ncbi:hypothetical protein O4H49_20285 [Kiloniella laminariae]|uniref:Uncharacterized protein n=1 Tax=Kiloniella laminariae TaxID=454162 RepID=A0ABT4LPS9_9PROT|nr:hypothetical protein [Kiloniella laminariae]MCZ4283134.1 hypothetical protein [Kiloniella laminariae]